MKQPLWFILFGIVLAFYAIREKQFALIYYTIWTFILEVLYFGARTIHMNGVADEIWRFLVAPAIVVCLGFWAIVAPMEFQYQPPENIVMILVTHGLNMIAVISEKRNIYVKDLWKPVLYTACYNIFLAIYVGGGGRNKSGHFPYWYAEYDKPIGWIFAALSTTAVGVTHFIIATPEPKKIFKQYIV